ncbi:unnamed protein product [Blepharisma stoltei]|uniref:RING-type domain-containing protein n=1 Tax=Blepharisma stoltei TaxID=1481888 RepID=A0AAU9JIH0_9CILI|nr:unnamed protein product [Blepharisma stoltei]
MISSYFRYWCHSCLHEFQNASEMINCIYCQSEYIEEIDPNEPHPQQFVPEMNRQQNRPVDPRMNFMVFGFQLVPPNIQGLMSMFGANSGPSPANEAAISRCSTLKFEELSEDCLDCPVCKDNFTKQSDLLKLPCNHIFHKECVVNWLKRRNSCPVCRFVIPTS